MTDQTRAVAFASNGWLLAAALIAVLAATVALEQVWPAFGQSADAPGRHRANVVLGILTLAVQALVPWAAAALTIGVRAQGFGGVLRLLHLPDGWLLAVSLATVSLTQYLLHRQSHRWRWLWRLHRVHHADTALDVTTAFRHHPLEPAIGFVWLSLVATVLGLAPSALVLYGIVATLLAIPQHADWSLGRGERWLGGWLVTPGVHHVHHSARRAETDSNYGDVVTVWDRLFGSWRSLSIEERGSLRPGLGGASDATAHSIRTQLAAWRD